MKIKLHNKTQIKSELQNPYILDLNDSYGEYVRYRERAILKTELFMQRCTQLILELFHPVDPQFKLNILQYAQEIFLFDREFELILLHFPQSVSVVENMIEKKYHLILNCAQKILGPSAFSMHQSQTIELKSSVVPPLFSNVMFFSQAKKSPSIISYAKDDARIGVKSFKSVKLARSFSFPASAPSPETLNGDAFLHQPQRRSRTQCLSDYDEGKNESLSEFALYRPFTPSLLHFDDVCELDSREFCLD